MFRLCILCGEPRAGARSTRRRAGNLQFHAPRPRASEAGRAASVRQVGCAVARAGARVGFVLQGVHAVRYGAEEPSYS